MFFLCGEIFPPSFNLKNAAFLMNRVCVKGRMFLSALQAQKKKELCYQFMSWFFLIYGWNFLLSSIFLRCRVYCQNLHSNAQCLHHLPPLISRQHLGIFFTAHHKSSNWNYIKEDLPVAEFPRNGPATPESLCRVVKELWFHLLQLCNSNVSQAFCWFSI